MRTFANRVRFALLCLLLGAAGSFAYSQEIDITSPEDVPFENRILYTNQNTFRIVAMTQGFGLGFNIGKIKNIYSTRIWDFEITNLFALKKIRVINPYTFGGKAFVYGKLNNCLVIRADYGEQRLIYGKPYWGGVETRIVYQGGLSLAILKPYYYEVMVRKIDETGGVYDVKEYQTFDQHDQWLDVLGRAPFTEGLKGIRVSPGLHFKAGFNFEFSKSDARVFALEPGLMLECYPMGVNLMADLGEKTVWKEIQKRAFLMFYLTFSMGKRFNKY